MYESIYISKTHILLVCIFDNLSGNEKIEPLDVMNVLKNVNQLT